MSVKMSWVNIRSITQSFEDRLNEYVVNHASDDEFLEFNRFYTLIKKWDKPPDKSIRDLYEMYK